ncbi:MAG: hypothetical protein K6G28_04090 [Acholeplasmatales bacterium]|jgi:hypothetical protein|nr:hypothetical protein [Acholeplasmatales bacterium]
MNTLKSIDIIFFAIILVIIVASIGIYFLIPVLNKKKYEQARAQLSERERIYFENKTGSEE